MGLCCSASTIRLGTGIAGLIDHGICVEHGMAMNQGSSATAVITAASVNGFDLATGLSATVSPRVGLTSVLDLNVVRPSSAGAVSSILTLTSQAAAQAGTYVVTISSSGRTRSHSATVTVTVASADFTVTTPANTLRVAHGGYNTTVITITSVSGFSGNVSLSATTPLAYIGLAGAPSFVVLTREAQALRYWQFQQPR